MDTHAVHNRLTQAGFAPNQADEIVYAVQESRKGMATKDKIEAIVERQTRIIILATVGIAAAMNGILFALLRFS